jgi:hypothetical protein
MCNRRSAALPAVVAAFAGENHPGSSRAPSGPSRPLRALLRHLFTGPVRLEVRGLRAKLQAAAPRYYRQPSLPGEIRKER